MENVTMPRFGLHAPSPLCEDGETLKKAVFSKDAATIHEMLEKGLYIEPQMGAGWHPLVLAATFGFCDIVDKIHKNEKPDDFYYHEALHAAAGEGHGNLVYQILGYGFDATSTEKFDVALAAMLGGHLDLLKEFMSKGFTTDLKCPVYMQGVIEHDHVDVLDFMLDHGASPAEARRIIAETAHKFPLNNSPEKCRSLLQRWSLRPKTFTFAHEKPLDINGLRKTVSDCGGGTVTAFLGMIKGDCFEDVSEAMRRPIPDRLDVSDFLVEDENGTSVIEILGAKRKLGLFLTPEIWRGHYSEALTLFEHIPPVYKDQIDMTAFTAEEHLDLLRKRKSAASRLRI